MTEDEQEAESRKYYDIGMILRTEAGNFALFGPNRQLYGPIINKNFIGDFLKMDIFWDWCRAQAKERPKSPAMRPEDIVDVDVGDLGL